MRYNVFKIDNLNIDVDYDKLAKALTDAILSAEKKKNNEKSITSDTLALLSSLIFRIFGGIGIFVSIVCIIWDIVISIQQWPPKQIITFIVANLTILIITIVIFLFSLLLIRSAKELEKERDKQFVVAVFSAIVSFSALVVALIALFK